MGIPTTLLTCDDTFCMEKETYQNQTSIMTHNHSWASLYYVSHMAEFQVAVQTGPDTKPLDRKKRGGDVSYLILIQPIVGKPGEEHAFLHQTPWLPSHAFIDPHWSEWRVLIIIFLTGAVNKHVISCRGRGWRQERVKQDVLGLIIFFWQPIDRSVSRSLAVGLYHSCHNTCP